MGVCHHVTYGGAKSALGAYEKMHQQCPHPSEPTLVTLLKACIRLRDVSTGSELHAEIVKHGLLESNIYLGNTVVDMYAKCGSLLEARNVFDRLPYYNVVTWTALIAGYIQLGCNEEALNLLEKMLEHGVLPNAHTFSCSLRACMGVGAVNKGCQLHAEIAHLGLLQRNSILGCTLVDMYTRCGLLAKAQEVFDVVAIRDIVLWTALIAGYTQHDDGERALECFEQMRFEGVCPNAMTFSSSIKACGSIGAIKKGIEIHAEILRGGLLERDHVLSSALVHMYGKCDLLSNAREVFDTFCGHDAVAWNLLIAVYVLHDHCEEVFKCFRQMQSEDVAPNAKTLALVLNACSSVGDLNTCREIHTKVLYSGLLDRHHVLGNALVDVYAKCGMLAEAKEMFHMLTTTDVVLWTALISGFMEHGSGVEALCFYKQMQQEGILPDTLTYMCSLKACCCCGATHEAIQIHAQAASVERLDDDLALCNALIDLYAKVGMLDAARGVFDELQVQDVVSWTALTSGYAEHERGKEALGCYQRMRLEGVLPDPITLACFLRACGNTGDLRKGQEIHQEIASMGLLKKDFVLGNALVDMYVKCGTLGNSHQVFDELECVDVVSWTTLITGYAQQGQTGKVLHIFDKMREEGKRPNSITFMSVLTACSHGGLVEKGKAYFEAMVHAYSITPTIEHLTCMVDLLGRAGQIQRAVELMKEQTCSPNVEMWLTILGACRKWGNVEIGRHAFEQVLLLDKQQISAYLCMYNLFVEVGLEEDAKKIEALRRERGYDGKGGKEGIIMETVSR